LNVVFDTNILVSAFWSPNGKAAYVLKQIIAEKLIYVVTAESFQNIAKFYFVRNLNLTVGKLILS